MLLSRKFARKPNIALFFTMHIEQVFFFGGRKVQVKNKETKHNKDVTENTKDHLVILQHGADPTKKNRDGNTPLDLVKEGDTDIQDLLRGDAALLDAAKKGCLARVQKLCTPENINCRDTQGRNSTPLHLAGKHHQHFGYHFQGSCPFLDTVHQKRKEMLIRKSAATQ